MKRVFALPLVTALILLLTPAAASAAPAATGYTVVVDGETATGRMALPEYGTPTVLVVVCHGYGSSAANVEKYVTDAAARGYIGVAMDYRGARTDWKVWAGWRDTVAATLDLKARYPTIVTTIIYGISMGGEVSGLSVAYAPPGTYQYWVEDSGVENLAEQWSAYPSFRPAIEAETGGTPSDVPQAYLDRSPLAQMDGIKAQGLKRAFVNHGVADTVVTTTQAHEMTAALVASGVPVSAYTWLGEGHVGGWGYQVVAEKAKRRKDWPAPLVEGVIGPTGFVPSISPPTV